MRKSASGEGSIRQRTNGSWEARVTTGVDPSTGKPIRQSIYGKTQTEVRTRLQEICVAVNDHTYAAPSKMTMAEWLTIWTREYLRALKPRTITEYTKIVNAYLVPAIGHIKLSDLKPPTIQRLYNNLDDQSLSAKTIANIHGVFHKALAQAVLIGYIKQNPAANVQLPRKEKKPIHAFTEAQISDFLSAIKDHRFEFLYFFMLFTGLRQSEILGLKWDDIDFESGILKVSRQLQQRKGQFVFESLKNNKPRRVPLAPFVLSATREYKRAQAQWRLLAGQAWADSGLVFTNEIGEHLNHVTTYKNFKKVVSGIGLPEFKLHDLRHSFAVNAVRSGMDIKTIADIMGHYSAAFTLDTYAVTTRDMETDAAAKLNAFFQRVKTS